jgi:uncharacterized protein (TIGR03083 family)
MAADARQIIGTLRNSHNRLVGLIEPLSEAELLQRSYDTDWTIAQVLSHLGSGVEIALPWIEAAITRTDPPGRETFPAIWDRWNSLPPTELVAEVVRWNARQVERFESLTDEELRTMHIVLFGIIELDGAGLAQSRLTEHAIHTWDVAVALDPSAQVSADAVAIIVDSLGQIVQQSYKSEGGEPRSIHVITTDPAREFRLTLGAEPSIEPWQGGEADAMLRLPAEALVRLAFGRLDADHSPELDEESAATLDSIRAGFKGF